MKSKMSYSSDVATLQKRFDRAGSLTDSDLVKTDKLDILRAKYQEAINAKQAEIRQIQDKLRLLDELDSDVQRLIEAKPETAKYAGWKLTRAVRDAIQTIGGNGGVTATEVRKYLAANGYHHFGKNFPVAVVIALTRLSAPARLEIRTEKKDGHRIYKKMDVSEFK